MNENSNLYYDQHLNESRQLWDAEAATFDNDPDHGLRDPVVRDAWTNLLKVSLPISSGAILDIGCGTGSLSLVLAELGHTVTGVDLSPAMIAVAQAKAQAAHRIIAFHIMDAAFPQLAPQQFNAIVCRHLLWTLPEPEQVLQRWIHLLRPGGCLLLIEGYWFTGAGLHADELVELLPNTITSYSVRDLSSEPDLWGRPINDERYALIVNL